MGVYFIFTHSYIGVYLGRMGMFLVSLSILVLFNVSSSAPL
jgi:hypothetical protein